MIVTKRVQFDRNMENQAIQTVIRNNVISMRKSRYDRDLNCNSVKLKAGSADTGSIDFHSNR